MNKKLTALIASLTLMAMLTPQFAYRDIYAEPQNIQGTVTEAASSRQDLGDDDHSRSAKDSPDKAEEQSTPAADLTTAAPKANVTTSARSASSAVNARPTPTTNKVAAPDQNVSQPKAKTNSAPNEAATSDDSKAEATATQFASQTERSRSRASVDPDTLLTSDMTFVIDPSSDHVKGHLPDSTQISHKDATASSDNRTSLSSVRSLLSDDVAIDPSDATAIDGANTATKEDLISPLSREARGAAITIVDGSQDPTQGYFRFTFETDDHCQFVGGKKVVYMDVKEGTLAKDIVPLIPEVETTDPSYVFDDFFYTTPGYHSNLLDPEPGTGIGNWTVKANLTLLGESNPAVIMNPVIGKTPYFRQNAPRTHLFTLYELMGKDDIYWGKFDTSDPKNNMREDDPFRFSMWVKKGMTFGEIQSYLPPIKWGPGLMFSGYSPKELNNPDTVFPIAQNNGTGSFVYLNVTPKVLTQELGQAVINSTYGSDEVARKKGWSKLYFDGNRYGLHTGHDGFRVANNALSKVYGGQIDPDTSTETEDNDLCMYVRNGVSLNAEDKKAIYDLTPTGDVFRFKGYKIKNADGSYANNGAITAGLPDKLSTADEGKTYVAQWVTDFTFKAGEHGHFADQGGGSGSSADTKTRVEEVSSDGVKAEFDHDFTFEPTADEGYRFVGWDKAFPETVTGPMEFIARYEAIYKFEEGTHGHLDGHDSPYEVNFPMDTTKADVLKKVPSVTADAGCEFIGWDTEFPEKVTGPMTFVAKYNIDYVFDKGAHGAFTDGDDQTKTIKFAEGTDKADVEAKLPTITPAKGYQLVGWDKTIPDKVTDPMTFVAQYKVEYTFNQGAHGQFDGGASEVVLSLTEGTPKADVIAQLPKLTANEGYEFTGWDVEIPATVGEPMTFVAKYNVDYVFDKGAHGTFTDSDDQTKTIKFAEGTAKSDVEENQPAITPATGYQLVGWDKAIPEKVTDPMTFIAQYKVEYTFKQGEHGQFDGGASEVVLSLTEGTPRADVIAQLPKLTANEGYEFTGWDVEIPETVGEPMTFVAKYNVDYVFDKGAHGTFTDSDDQTKTIKFPEGTAKSDVEENQPAITPATGYQLVGWDKAIPEKVTDPMTFVAQYKVEYTFKQGEHGQFDGGASEVVLSLTEGTPRADVIAQLPKLTANEGYAFSGWDVEIPEAVGEPMTFVALYKKLVKPEPSQPSEPTKPSDPVSPDQPTDPKPSTDPNAPVVPTTPTAPTASVDPSSPSVTTTPSGTVAPATKPVAPVDPKTKQGPGYKSASPAPVSHSHQSGNSLPTTGEGALPAAFAIALLTAGALVLILKKLRKA